MHILIVTAHPSTQGFTHKIAAEYAAVSKFLGHEVEILDLYRTEIKQEYLSFEDKTSQLDTPDRRIMQEKIVWADELVFVHPLWWGGVPAIMKNWLDVNLSSHFAYQYTKSGPQGLLKGKQGRVFITGGGSWLLYLCLLFPFFIVWGLMVLFFCGIKVKSLTYFGSKPTKTPEQLEGWLRKVRRIAGRNR